MSIDKHIERISIKSSKVCSQLLLTKFPWFTFTFYSTNHRVSALFYVPINFTIKEDIGLRIKSIKFN